MDATTACGQELENGHHLPYLNSTAYGSAMGKVEPSEIRECTQNLKKMEMNDAKTPGFPSFLHEISRKINEVGNQTAH